MDVRQLLEAVKKDEIDIDTAVNKLKDLPYEDLGYANIDHHRELRNGFPEVIYCEGKTDEHIIGIVDVLLKKQSNVLGTRCRKETAEKLKKIYDNQLEKHQTYLERDINRLNELFDNQIDFTREGDVDTLYLFVDKRIQYHDNGTNRHAIPIFMLAYLFENNSSKRQLILSDVFSEIREMKSRVRYERIKLKELVHLGEITVI